MYILLLQWHAWIFRRACCPSPLCLAGGDQPTIWYILYIYSIYILYIFCTYSIYTYIYRHEETSQQFDIYSIHIMYIFRTYCIYMYSIYKYVFCVYLNFSTSLCPFSSSSDRRRPANILMKVVLPVPFSPNITTISESRNEPALTCSLHTHKYVFICISVCMRTQRWPAACVHINTYAYINKYMYVYTALTCSLHIHKYVHTFIMSVCMYTLRWPAACIHINTYTFIQVYVCIHHSDLQPAYTYKRRHIYKCMYVYRVAKTQKMPYL